MKKIGITSLFLIIVLTLGVIFPVQVAKAATITVTSTSDSTGGPGCTLRDAITAADTDTATGGCPAGSGADTIMLASGTTYALTIATLPAIHSQITIQGNGSTVERSSAGGIPEFRIFYVSDDGDLTLNDLTVSNGLTTVEGDGGGIKNWGTLTMNNSTISGNTGAGILTLEGSLVGITNSTISGNSGGGIINNRGLVDINNCTISGNSERDRGGGISNYLGSVEIYNSTIIGNSASLEGGGIRNRGVLTLTNSTVSANSSDGNGGGIWNYEEALVIQSTISGNQANAGSGIYHDDNGTMELANTIIAAQLSGHDCAGDPISSLGYNLDSDGTCNLAGTGDISGANPQLSPLDDHGGPTMTHALLQGSPALDAIPAGACDVTTDQRGASRPQGSGCEIGAYEHATPSISKTVDDPSAEPGQTITFQITVNNTLPWPITDGQISDSLPAGLNFVGPITLTPPSSGTIGSALPTLVTDLQIGVGGQVIVTFPVSVSSGIEAGTVINNTASVTSDEVTIPVLGSTGVTVVNLPPVAVSDSGTGFTTNEDAAFTTPNVLTNDDDPNGDTLTVQSINTSGTEGIVTNNGNGTFDYDPDGQFEDLQSGQQTTDSFDYTVSDGHGGTDSATVTITIQGINDPPDADDDSGAGFITDEDSTITTANVLTNDDDVEDDSLSVQSIDISGTMGHVTDKGDGTFDYDPDGQFEGLQVGQQATDIYTYTISDGYGGTDSARVTITINGVNDAPTAEDDSGTGFATDKDTPFMTTNVLTNDEDPEDDALTIQSVDTSATKGQVTDNGDGTFDYDPDGQFEHLGHGEQDTDSFDYTVSDGNGGTDTATVTVTIHGVNEAPTALDDSGTGFGTDEDTPFTTGNVLTNDDDLDGDTLTVQSIDTSGTKGQVTDNGDGTFDYDPDGQFEDLEAGDQATDTFTYTINDGHGGTDSATVTISITGVDDAFELYLPLVTDQ